MNKLMKSTFIMATVLVGNGWVSGSVVQAAQQTLAVTASRPSTASIKVDGEPFASGVPMFVQHHTAWLPLHEVMQAIASSGDSTTYNGRALLINNVALQSRTLWPQPNNILNIVNGAYVLSDVPVRVLQVNRRWTTYVPIWYVMQALTQGTSGYFATWNGQQLSLNNNVTGAPSLSEIETVMWNTTETQNPTEHFVLTGSPISTSVGNGDTFTAAMGTRYPSADGYGQVVFFFHNQKFIGLDSNVEKTAIRSVKLTNLASVLFRITYANYAPSDALYNPSLPPAAGDFGWNGDGFAPVSDASIPKGAINGIQVRVCHIAGSTTVPVTPQAKRAVQQALPKCADLLGRPGMATPYLVVDVIGHGQDAVAAAYKGPSGVGLVVVGQTVAGATWQPLYNGALAMGTLNTLNAGAMTGDDTEEIECQASIGATSHEVLVLKWVNDKLQPVFHGIGVAVLEDIHMYAWNVRAGMFKPAHTADFPTYFAGEPLMYDVMGLSPAHAAFATPPKMEHYAMAVTDMDMGDYGKAASEARLGLKFPNADYPSNYVLQGLLRSSMAKQAALRRYLALPPRLKHMVERVVLKYSGFYNPVAESLPLVYQDANGGIRVSVIGTFNNMLDNQYVLASRLDFTVNAQGTVAGSFVARDAIGNMVWQTNQVTALPTD